MSAWMVNKEHIDALEHCAVWAPRRGARYPGDGWCSGGQLRWWTVDPVVLHQLPFDALPTVRREARPESADAVGAMLVSENLASIHQRYPDTRDGGAIPSPCAAYWETPYAFAFVRPVRRRSRR